MSLPCCASVFQISSGLCETQQALFFPLTGVNVKTGEMFPASFPTSGGPALCVYLYWEAGK